MTRAIVIGDIHGCIDEFRELVAEVELQEGDRLILLGDLIDRGPDPFACLEYALSLKAECVMGNHEEKALRWRKHEKKRAAQPDKYKNPMAAVNEKRLEQWNAIPDELWDWVATWPTFIHVSDQWTAVHAGCMPLVPIAAQKPNELMRLRYVNVEKGKMATPDERGERPENAVHWTELWTGPRSIVYGHYTYKDIVVEDRHHPVWTAGIDTGCVHGDLLTAAIFFPGNTTMEGFEVKQVAAKKVYSERKAWNDSVD